MKYYKKHNINHLRSLFFTFGLVVSLFLVITAFQWQTLPTNTMISCPFPEVDQLIIPEMPATTQPPPPSPKPKVNTPSKIIVKLEETLKTNLIPAKISTPTIENFEYDHHQEPPINAAEAPFEIIEDPPLPIGGYQAFGAFLKKHLKYPRQAKRLNIEGKVFVQFVVNENGSITNLTILKGIGAGCDKEAIRVLKKHPKWKPGYQRGRAVKVKMVLPIIFNLH